MPTRRGRTTQETRPSGHTCAEWERHSERGPMGQARLTSLADFLKQMVMKIGVSIVDVISPDLLKKSFVF